ncbi:hypothetical protein, partial [Streptomyces sp. NRRL S-118]|uniref:hypothetical protein n=1 Tax=Streptomyces sp. NRRL S-118 TaxID=1463881 RepID=UPI001F266D9B
DRRRPLGHGPKASATPPSTPAAEPRARVLAAEADLDTGLHHLQLPDLAELRDRGVLDPHVLGDWSGEHDAPPAGHRTPPEPCR